MPDPKYIRKIQLKQIGQFGPQKLKAEEVHLWVFFDKGEILPLADDFLSKYEQDRMQFYRTALKRREFLIGRWLMKRVLAQYVDAPWQEIYFSTNERGRPESSFPVDINLSHSFGGYSCIVGKSGRVGVDVEYVQRKVNTRAVHHVFSPEETDALEKLEGEEARDLFFKIWTLKEAIWKAADLGVQLLFNTFFVSFDPLCVHTHTDMLETTGWQLNNFLPYPDYMISTAIFAPDSSPFHIKAFQYLPANSRL